MTQKRRFYIAVPTGRNYLAFGISDKFANIRKLCQQIRAPVLLCYHTVVFADSNIICKYFFHIWTAYVELFNRMAGEETKLNKFVR